MLDKICIKNIKNKGRGVFAAKNIKKGEILEVCPIIQLNSKERKKCDATILAYYIYPWKTIKCGAIVLGYGFIYNHSYDSNADWVPNYKTKSMVYKAVKNIKKGEEITVNYNGEPDDTKPIDWFDVK